MEYSQILKDLRRESGSVKNRIQSIIFDSKYVAQFSEFPLVANERCGLWYVEPKNTAGSVYFKSTDGHTGQWKFSMRRLNFHLLDLFQNTPTVILVDSTRKGKLMPDALSKTVPMWCAVLNYIMFEDEKPDKWTDLATENWLSTPREMVSESEHSTMIRLVPSHAREVKKLALISKQGLIERLGCKKPILPSWVYPGKKSQRVVTSEDHFSICCLTASYKSNSGTDVPGWNFSQPYVQGAADDHELWASSDICEGKLDHNLLWNDIYYEPAEELRVIDTITGDICSWISEGDFLTRISRIYEKSKREPEESSLDVTSLQNTGIMIGAITKHISVSEITKTNRCIKHIVMLSEKWTITQAPGKAPEKCTSLIQSFKVESSKKGSKKLREILPQIMQNIKSVDPLHQTLILCDTGKDLSAGVALTLLARFFDTNWVPVTPQPHVNKDTIKQHLCHVSDYRQVNPSRNTLQSINTFLMSNGH
ncbi:hypothetical protein OXX80_001070 [Metschnikowia pulcherrima]